MRWAGYVARRETEELQIGFWWRWDERKRPLGRPRRRWEDNVKRDLQDVRWEGMDWIDLAKDRDKWPGLVIVVMNLRVP
jgi:hypothetical protein